MTFKPAALAKDDYCFACGARNPAGLQLVFRPVGEEITTSFTPRREHQGFVGITHGGLIGLVLDEAMARLLWARGIKALTCELTVRLRQAVPVGEPLKISASLKTQHQRLLTLEARAIDSQKRLIAIAQGKFLRVD